MANFNSDYTGAQIDSAISRANSTDVTAGTVAASKAVVVDSNKDITGFRHITATGTVTAANVSLTGNVDLGDASGDTVTITGSIDSNLIPATDDTYDIGSASNAWQDLFLEGDINFSDGAQIDVASGDFTLDVAGDIEINADGGDINFKDASSTYATITSAGITTANTVSFGSLTDGTITITDFVDEDNMSSDSAVKVPTQSSVKAYVDATVTAQDLDFSGDSGGALNIDLDSESLTLTGGTGVVTVGSGNTMTFNSVDSEIVHDSLSGFVANEHIDHTAVTLTAGVGLSGGGTIAANRTFTVDLNELTTETTIADADFIAMVDATDDGSGKITFENLEDAIFASVSGDVTITEGGVAQIADNAVDLTTHSTGNYVATITGGTGIDSSAATSGEGTTHSLSVDLNELTTETTIADADFIAMVDATDDASGKITFENLEDAIFSSVSGDVLITEAGVASIQANAVALATDTTGDYVQNITAGTGLTSNGATSGENIAHSLSVDANQTQIVQVGTLAVGAISSGFGAIDIGSSTANFGATTVDSLSASDGNITNVGDIALDSISADDNDINVAITNNRAAAFEIKQGSDKYFGINTTTDGDVIQIGTGITGTAITLGHSTSEITVADNLTITGNLKVNGDQVYQNVTQMAVTDPIISLQTGTDGANLGADTNKDVGLAMFWHNGSAAKTAFLGFDDSAGKLTFIPDASISSEVATGTAGTIVANLEGNVTGNVTGNTSGTALTVTQAAQTAITSLGTLTALTVDNIGVNGNTITANSGALNLTPASGSAIVLDGTISVDAGVVTGATSITSTAFVGDITGDVTGNADTATKIASITNSNIVQLTSSQTLTNKTLTSPKINEDVAVTSTASELNIMDGSATDQATVTLQAADGVVISDGDVMKQALVSDFEVYMEANLDTMGSQFTSASALATVGTIGTGVWQGTPITSAYLNAAQTAITSVGTLTALTTASLQVNGTSGTNPVTIIKGAVQDTVSEFIRVGRSDSTARYHSIKTLNSATGANNYLSFEVHDASSTTATTEVLKLKGDKSATFAGNIGVGSSTVSSPSSASRTLRIQHATGSASLVLCGDNDNETAWDILANTSGQLDMRKNNSSKFLIEADGTVSTSGAFQPAGNVTCGANLTVNGATRLGAASESSFSVLAGDNASGAFRFSSGDANENIYIEYYESDIGGIAFSEQIDTGGSQVWNKYNASGTLIQSINQAGVPTWYSGGAAMSFEEHESGAVLWLDGVNGDMAGGDYWGLQAVDGGGSFEINRASVTKMTITSAGSVGIGTDAPAHKLEVKNTASIDSATRYTGFFNNDVDDDDAWGIYIHGGNAGQTGNTEYVSCYDHNWDKVGMIHNDGGTFSLVDVSDKRLKKNIRNTDINGIDTINSIKVRDFEYKINNNTVKAQFIAQEIQEVFPQASTGTDGALTEDGKIDPMGVTKEGLVGVLVKAVQELSIANAELKSRIEALENA